MVPAPRLRCLPRPRGRRTRRRWARGAASWLLLAAIACGGGGDEAPPESRDLASGGEPSSAPAPLAGDSLLLVANVHEAPLHFLPQDWPDLFHFRFADELLMPSPESSPPVRAFMEGVLRAEARRVGAPEAGFDWLRRLDTTVLAYENEADDIRWRLRQGDAWFALLPASEVGPLLEREGFRVVTLRSGSDPLRWDGAAEGGDGAAAGARAPDEAPEIPGDWLARWASQVRGRG